MTGWDGGFFGLPFTCECRIYGETEGRKNCSKFKKRVTKSDLLNKIQSLEKENEQLKTRLRGMNELLQSYQKTIKHDAELLVDASKNSYLPLLDDYGWICGCCKHFHSGVRDRCDEGNNWVLKDGSCQNFER